jgi:putative nucleotidyltransferase with HDIG domain
MMLALSETVDAKDHYTNGHSERVAKYSAELARRLGKNSKEQERIYAIALLHDIGKIGVSEEIINKTERLTDEEFAQIKKHTVIGNEILKGIVDLPELCLGARSHHERYGGGGYPDGLKGDEIPEVARIICVADCYDAMTSTRTYSDPKPQAVVRAEIERCSGVQFDPRVAKAMLSMIDDDKDFIMNERAGAKGIWKGKAKFWDFGTVPEAEIADHASKSREGSAPTTQGPRRDNLLKEIEKIPEIDIDQGILNCGSADSFLSVLEVFHQTAPQKADEIEKLFSQGDIEGYTIKVHALKGSARVIGALELSGMAKELEAAGKAGDKEMIEHDTKALLQKYRELDKALSIY